MSFTHNDWGQCDIINDIIILTKWGADRIYTVIPTNIRSIPQQQCLNMWMFWINQKNWLISVYSI